MHAVYHASGRPRGESPQNTEQPIRSERFSVERLEQHAESLASAQRVTAKPAAGHPLVARLEDNGRVLLQAYRAIAKAVTEEQVIMPAAEWLVDILHVVDLADLLQVRRPAQPERWRP